LSQHVLCLALSLCLKGYSTDPQIILKNIQNDHRYNIPSIILNEFLNLNIKYIILHYTEASCYF